MIYTIGGIVVAVLAVCAWVYSLITRNTRLQQTVASQTVKDKLSGLDGQVIAQEGKVTEDVRDYSKAKDDFNNKYSDGGDSKPGSS